MKKIFYFTVFFLLQNRSFALWDQKIIDLNNSSEINRQELLSKLGHNNIIVMGEKHYTEEVQRQEGLIISDLVTYTHQENQFSLSWEFLNASSQLETANLFNQVVNKQITATDLLKITQGSKSAAVYSPMIEATANLGGQLFGVNLSREEKAPVVTNGLGALDPKLLPPNFQLGGKNYLERFTETMKDHATPNQIINYFAAQSLVDDVSAFHLNSDSNNDLKFLVIGAFHTMFNDGVVARIKLRNTNASVANIEIIDASDFTSSEITSIYEDEKYGKRANYIIFVNEPNEAANSEKLIDNN
jgi:uncharacterized iron-regulated protein